MSLHVNQCDDFQLFVLHLKWDNVDAWQGTNNHCIQRCLCHSHKNACVGFIRREELPSENIFKYIAGFNKNISAECHPTVFFQHLQYMTFLVLSRMKTTYSL